MEIFEKNTGKPAREKDLAESVVSREIVQEILKFGVSQYQIQKVIKLLALELEDNKMMKSICGILEGSDNKEQKKALIIKE